jgi:hypothetical protein
MSRNSMLLNGIGISGNIGSGFNPSLAGNPLAWYEVHGQSLATNGQLATNNVEIARVLPLQGRFGEMAQTTGSSQPLYITNQTSTGLAVARFDGVNDFFDCTFSLTALRNIPSFSIIFIVKLNTVGIDQTLFFGNRNTAGSGRFIWRIVTANSGLCFVRTLDSDTGGSPSTTGFTATTGTFYTFHVSVNYATSKVDAWVNGTQRITNVTPATNTAGNTSDTDSGAQISIGRDSLASRYLSGDLVAWGAYSNVFTAQQVSDSYSAIQTFLGV